MIPTTIDPLLEAIKNLTYVNNYPVIPFTQLYTLSNIPTFNISDSNSIKQALIDSYLQQFRSSSEILTTLIENEPTIQLFEVTIVNIVNAIVEFEGKDKASKDFADMLSASAIAPPAPYNSSTTSSRRRRSALRNRLGEVEVVLTILIITDTEDITKAFAVLKSAATQLDIIIITERIFLVTPISLEITLALAIIVGKILIQVYDAFVTVARVLQDLATLINMLLSDNGLIDLQSINYYPETMNCDKNSLNIDLNVRSISETPKSPVVEKIVDKIQKFIDTLTSIQTVLDKLKKFSEHFSFPSVQEAVDKLKLKLTQIISGKLKPDPGNEDVTVDNSDNCQGTFDNYVCDCTDLDPGTYTQTFTIQISAFDFADSRYDLHTSTDLIVPPCPPLLDTDDLCKIKQTHRKCYYSACGNNSNPVYMENNTINYCYKNVPYAWPQQVFESIFDTGGTHCTQFTQDDLSPQPVYSGTSEPDLEVTISGKAAVGKYPIAGGYFYSHGYFYNQTLYPAVASSGLCGYGCSEKHDRCAPCPCCQYTSLWI